MSNRQLVTEVVQSPTENRFAAYKLAGHVQVYAEAADEDNLTAEDRKIIVAITKALPAESIDRISEWIKAAYDQGCDIMERNRA